MPTMFSEADLAQQQRLKCAFDAGGLLNPAKVFPTLSACVEGGHMHVKDGASRSRTCRGFESDMPTHIASSESEIVEP